MAAGANPRPLDRLDRQRTEKPGQALANHPIGGVNPADNRRAGNQSVSMEHRMCNCPCGSAKDNPAQPAVAAELLAVSAQLGELEGLLSHASRRLFACFAEASRLVTGPEALSLSEQHRAVRQALSEAGIALQFEDIAQQKLIHAQSRLSNLAAVSADGPSQSPLTVPLASDAKLPRPIEQTDVHAGSIDFF